MARLTYTEARGFEPQYSVGDLMAVLATGQNPDGTPFAMPVESAPPASEATHAIAVGVATATWTTIVSVTPAADRALLSAMGDLAALLGTRYQLRLTIGGAVQFAETVHTDQVSAARLHGLRVPAGVAVALQARHTEATAQDIAGTLIHRAA